MHFTRGITNAFVWFDNLGNNPSQTTILLENTFGWAAAVENAKNHGANVIAGNLQGPAGVASFIRDPGGAPIARWKRSKDM